MPDPESTAPDDSEPSEKRDWDVPPAGPKGPHDEPEGHWDDRDPDEPPVSSEAPADLLGSTAPEPPDDTERRDWDLP